MESSIVVLLGFFGAVLANPVPLDTPEVAAARSAHLAIHAAEASRNVAHGAYQPAPAPLYHKVPAQASQYHAYAPGHNAPYHGPLALPPGYDKHGAPLPVLDTPEVAAEKHQKLSALAHYGGATHPAAPYPGDWQDHDDGRGPIAPASGHGYAQSYAPVWAGHGHAQPAPISHGAVVDTPEVAHAKAAHFAAHAAARAHHPTAQY